MVDVCLASNVTISKWDNDKELRFVMGAFLTSDILFIISIAVLYFYCASSSKNKVPHLETPAVEDNSQISPTTENKYSIINFRSSSCPPLFT